MQKEALVRPNGITINSNDPASSPDHHLCNSDSMHFEFRYHYLIFNFLFFCDIITWKKKISTCHFSILYRLLNSLKLIYRFEDYIRFLSYVLHNNLLT